MAVSHDKNYPCLFGIELTLFPTVMCIFHFYFFQISSWLWPHGGLKSLKAASIYLDTLLL